MKNLLIGLLCCLLFTTAFAKNELITAPPVENTITVTQAIYGDINGGSSSCDATIVVDGLCSGLRECKVWASNSLCGNPSEGLNKILVVTYTCGKRGKMVFAPESGVADLDCIG